MGTFYTSIEIGNVVNRHKAATFEKALVDTGSEHTWVPGEVLESLNIQRENKDLAFVMANGTQITRTVGFAIVRVGAVFTVDEVVFGQPGDRILLGARSLEGLNLSVDAAKKKLVAARPVPAA